MKTAKWLESITASKTLAVNQKVIELKAKGAKIINLVVGEPDFETPQFIKDSAYKALNNNYTKYSETEGVKALRVAVTEKLQRENKLNYDPTQLIITCGAKQAISMALFVLVDPGEEVLVPSPYWVSYPDMVKLARGIPVFVETKVENRYKLSVEDLEKVYSPKTKAIILNNPSNPTGVLYTSEELKEIADWCSKKGVVIISDEVYEKIIFSGREFVSTASLSKQIYDNTVTINGFSKSYCMTGWRVGYACAPVELVKAMAKFQSHFLSHIPTFIQYACVDALKDTKFVGPMVEAYQERVSVSMDLISKLMPESVCVEPDGAFYLFPTIDKYLGRSFNGKVMSDSVELATFLLEEAGVAIVPGMAFGMDNNIRLSVATSLEQIKEGINKMGEALSKLK